METYNTYNREFTECYEYFNFDFDRIMKLVGKYGHIECAKLRDERCPNGTEEERKQVFKTIKFKSQRFMQLMQARKGFINNHPKKIDAENPQPISSHIRPLNLRLHFPKKKKTRCDKEKWNCYAKKPVRHPKIKRW